MDKILKDFQQILEDKKVFFNNWQKPNWEDELCELKRTSRDLKLKYSFLKEKCIKKGFLTDLDYNFWSKLENTSSFKISDLSDVYDFLVKVERTRDWQKIVLGFKNNDKIPSPIVCIKSDNIPYLVGGNTRLMISKALGIQPKIWLFFINGI